MTSVTDICNRALQSIGTRTTVTDAELAANSTNEAIQFNIIYENLRDDLLRMAPWDCGLKTANLTYITSQPGTPENTSPATQLWQPGQPTPPWAYEYQYPVDCLRACFIIPATQSGFSSGVPITTAVTGGASAYWWGQPIRFKVQTDQFIPANAVAIDNGGTGYGVGDIITLPIAPSTSQPIGAPAQIRVLTVDGAGVILTAELVNVIAGSASPLGGSYFTAQANPIAQASVIGSQGLPSNGAGATFNLAFGPRTNQRVILTNQEFATLTYVCQVIDPNNWDTLFQSALIDLVGAALCMALTGDKKLANMCVESVNRSIQEARAVDGNEGLTVNDVTPDWLRTRGINFSDGYSGPYGGNGFDWGSGLWSMF
jgi:hypothetical protein